MNEFGVVCVVWYEQVLCGIVSFWRGSVVMNCFGVVCVVWYEQVQNGEDVGRMVRGYDMCVIFVYS